MRFVFSAVLIQIVSLFAAPAASATLLGDTAETVRSTVEAVQGALNDPSLPSAPSAPSATPTATPPPVPPAPDPPAPAKTKAPAERPSAPSSAGSGSGAPSATGVTAAAGNAVKDVVGSVAGAGRETAGRAPVSTGDEDGGLVPVGGQASSSRRGGDAGPAETGPGPVGAASGAPGASERRARRATDIAPGTSLSIAEGQVVALQRWLTHVWPGIPLLGGEAGGGAAARVLEAGLLDPAAAVAGELLFAAASATTTTAGDVPLATLPPAARDRYSDLLGVMSSTDWRKIVYRIALVVLLVLLAFTVWRDFRPALRPGVR